MKRRKISVAKRFVFVLSLLLFAVGTGNWEGRTSQAAEPQGKPQVIGHRGGAGLAPENTLAAFRKALDLGVDGLEMDVLLTSDGEIVVHHDFSLRPEIARGPDGEWLSGSAGPVIKNLSLAEIKTYDVGRLKPHTLYAGRYPEQQPADGERIPTLREVITLVKNRDATKTMLFIEIKTSPEKPDVTPSPETVADALVKCLKGEGFLPRARILSFDWRGLVHVQKIAPQVPTVYLSLISNGLDNIKPGKPGPSPWTAGIDVDDYQGSLPKAISAAGGRYWGPHYKSVTPQLVEEAHRLGIKVYPWTVDLGNDMTRLMKMKVDGIITNRPDILKALVVNP